MISMFPLFRNFFQVGNFVREYLSFSHEKTILVHTINSIFPPQSGGQNRIYYLYKEVAKEFNVILVVPTTRHYHVEKLAEDFIQLQIPKNKEHAQLDRIIARHTGISSGDVSMMYEMEKNKILSMIIKWLSNKSSLHILSHPYMFNYIRNSELPMVYDSHNVEYLLKKQMFDKNAESRKILDDLRILEEQVCCQAEFIANCSESDASIYKTEFGISDKKIQIVPNGVDLQSIHFVSKQERKRIKRELVKEDFYALFMGSMHQPNVEAVKNIIKIAKTLNSMKFIIIGNVAEYFQNREIPVNIKFLGIVSEEKKRYIQSYVDMALNPMLSGSGSNLKILEYAAAGIPIITTKFGIRGFGPLEAYVKICPIEKFAEQMENIEVLDTEKANTVVRKEYSWQQIGKVYRKSLKELLR